MPVDPVESPFPPDLHTIRLQGPWRFEWEPREESDRSATVGTIRLPITEHAMPVGRQGTLRLIRRFQRPTRLEAHEQVWLLLPPGCRPARVRLNEAEVPCLRRIGDYTASDLTAELRPSNELRLEFVIDAETPLPTLDRPVLLGILPERDEPATVM